MTDQKEIWNEEMIMLDEAFSIRSQLSETEESTLYYIPGYFAFKEKIVIVKPTDFTKHIPS